MSFSHFRPLGRTSILSLLLLCICASAVYFRYLPKNLNTHSIEELPVDFAVIPKAKLRMQKGEDFFRGSWDNSYFKYSPGFVALLGPFPESPPQFWVIAKAIYLLLWIFGIWLSFYWTQSKEILLLGIGISMGWMGLLETFSYGQIESILLGGALIAWSLLRYPKIVGLILGFLPMIKLPWGFLLIPFGIHYFYKNKTEFKHYFLFFCLACLSWLVIIPLIKWGPTQASDLYYSWYLTLTQNQGDRVFVQFVNQSIWSSISRLLDTHAFGRVAAIFVFGVYVYLFRSLVKVTKTSFADRSAKMGLPLVCAWLLFLQLTNPLGWHFGAQFLVGIPLILSNVSFKNPTRIDRILIASVLIIFLLYLRPVTKLIGLQKVKNLEEFELIMLSWLLAIFIVTEKIRPRALRQLQ